MQDAHAFVEARLAHLDEFRRRTLEPGRRHPAVVVPDGAKALPVAGIAPQRPVLHDLDDGGFLIHQSTFIPVSLTSFDHFCTSSRRNFANSSTGMPIGTAPCLLQFSLTSGALITLMTSALSLSSTGRGVPAGAISPSQMVAS